MFHRRWRRAVAATLVALLGAATIFAVPADAAAPTVSLAVSPNPVAPSSLITLTATITDPSAPPTGAKVVFCYTDPRYSTCDVQQNNTLAETFVDSSGVAQATTAIATAGTYDAYATYYGIDGTGTITGYDSNHVALVVGSTSLSSLNIGDVSIREGKWPLGNVAVLPVTLSIAVATPVTATAITTSGTARAGSDYLAVPFPIRIAPGHTTAYVVVLIIGDRIKEPDETFTVSMTNITGAVAGHNPATVTILNDD